MDDFLQPLVNQPGARFEYGVSRVRDQPNRASTPPATKF